MPASAIPRFFGGMKSAAGFALALMTAPNLKVARRLAADALGARLAACVNLVPRLESHYWWQGRLERSPEVLMIFKTRRALLPALEKRVMAAHPYDTAEFLVVPLASGTEKYLRWLEDATGSSKPVKRRKA